jgi:two-component system copper resistance phosphate regulon response regulator CusR
MRKVLQTMQVLIIEDETSMAGLLKKGLEEENHRVALAFDGRTGFELAQMYDFDAIILDLMLPAMDGHEVARRLREQNNNVAILMLTARDSVPDIAKGLDLGADDYLTKPFSFVELLARLRSVTRRRTSSPSSVLQLADLRVDPAACRVSRGDTEIRLTATEFRLLEFLLRRSGRVLPRWRIVESVWGIDENIEENTLEAFISLLRNKIDKGFEPKLLHTVRGIGYCLREEQ